MPDWVHHPRPGTGTHSLLDLRFHRRIHPYQCELPDVKILAVLFSTVAIALAQPPPEMPKADLSKDVEDLFRTAAEALADKDPAACLGKFDPKMPGFLTLRDEILALLDHSDVGTTWDVVTDEGDNQKRALQLDWLLHVDEDQPRRQILKFRIERQGKKWKIVSLEPIEFFKPVALP
jgi:hypothetical protein